MILVLDLSNVVGGAAVFLTVCSSLCSFFLQRAWEMLILLLLSMMLVCKFTVMNVFLPLADFAFAVQLLVVVMHGVLFLTCDLVAFMVSRLVPPQWSGSSTWQVCCLSIWLLVLAVLSGPYDLCKVPICSPICGQSLSGWSVGLWELLRQPLVIFWSQAGLAVSVHRLIIGDSDIGGSNVLLSTKLYRRFKRNRNAMNRQGSKSILSGIAFGGLLACYLSTRLEELRQTPWRSTIMGVYLVNKMSIVFGSSDANNPMTCWKAVCQIAPVPVYSTPDEQDDDCGECAICLDPLCTSTHALTAISLSRQRCRPSLSACRLRPRASMTGLSALRTGSVQFCKETLSGIWGRMATLPCGHKFHTGCLDGVISTKLQCPICRGMITDDNDDLERDQRILYKIGLMCIFVFYCVVYIWDVWARVQIWQTLSKYVLTYSSVDTNSTVMNHSVSVSSSAVSANVTESVSSSELSAFPTSLASGAVLQLARGIVEALFSLCSLVVSLI